MSCLPTYNPLGGPQGKGHVSFDRLQVLSLLALLVEKDKY
jgi:hypothetical protein